MSSSESASKPPWGLRWRSSTLFIIITVGIGIFSDLFLYCVAVPVIPFLLHDRLHIPSSDIQFYLSLLLSIFAGASLIFSPIAAIIADMFTSRQQPFLLGLIALLGSTILLGLGQNFAVLAVARTLQGMSGAVVWTVGLVICLETVGPERLGLTMGSIFSITSLGTEISPTIGGLLYDKTGYRGVFAVQIAVISVDLVMRLFIIEKKTARQWLPVEASPAPGSPAAEAGANSTDEETPLLRDGDGTANEEEEDPTCYSLEPPKPWVVRKVPILACMGSGPLRTALFVNFIQAFLFASYDATVPVVAREYFFFDAFQVGMLFLALGIPALVFGPLAGWWVDTSGTKKPVVTGFLILAPALACMRFVQPVAYAGAPETLSRALLYAGLLFLSGIGIHCIGAPGIVEAGAVMERYYKANPDHFGRNGPYAQLYGMNSAVISAGFAIGPAIAGGLKETIGYGNMNAVMSVIAVGGGVLSFCYVGGRRKLWSWPKGGKQSVP